MEHINSDKPKQHTSTERAKQKNTSVVGQQVPRWESSSGFGPYLRRALAHASNKGAASPSVRERDPPAYPGAKALAVLHSPVLEWLNTDFSRDQKQRRSPTRETWPVHRGHRRAATRHQCTWSAKRLAAHVVLLGPRVLLPSVQGSLGPENIRNPCSTYLHVLCSTGQKMRRQRCVKMRRPTGSNGHIIETARYPEELVIKAIMWRGVKKIAHGVITIQSSSGGW